MASKWTAGDIPDQRGRVAVVTGANSGLGRATATELARAGATIIVACRDTAKGEAAASAIALEAPGAGLEVERLDLAELASVRDFAARLGHDKLDLLINNAGVMAPPRRLSADGFESQLATNHLGHFALTGLLLDRLMAAPEPRVVTLSSGLHRLGRMRWNDLNGERRYNSWLAYGQSKLANLLFCFELERRARAAGTELRSLAAHPGYAATNLQFAGPRWYERGFMRLGNAALAQSAEMGALPTLYAATAPGVPGGSFIGPDAWFEQRGHPHVVTAAGRAYDEDDQRRLWEISEDMTGVRPSFTAAA